MLLKDKVAIITGAASARGLGFATAKLFAENGAKVVIIDLNGEASKTAAAALGEGHLGLAANVADEVQVQAAIEQILAKYGRVDVLVNNAGITQPLKLMDIKRANYDAVLDVSLRGTLLMSQAVIPTMRAQKSGSIVCIEKGDTLRFDVDHKVRLIDIKEYAYGGYPFLRGFISGLHAGNFDITHIFIDNLYKLSQDSDPKETENFLDWCSVFSAENSVAFTLTIAGEAKDAPEYIARYMD